ncbi:IS110 family RNA-guided transposase [Noviherbaspirillum autotrophicum]|uniref:Transposase n=1 Tax=Noviherbaspirillum autotrophicum TaxID=709839 RepID=A0A0C1YNC5_9BURK|nr:IS110 family transposase [Noviherbaspirillum autotrophicum]KIF82067.1 transposase [Noviherbaspirillum autotrophicum]
MHQLTTIGIDLAKDVIAACVMDQYGAVTEQRVLRREAFERWAAQLEPAMVAMEACGSAHHWGRWFAARGHTTRLIAPEFVVPFRKGGKNDTADAEAVAIAARQPTMRFVPIKTADQQAMLAWHCAREGWKEERVALLNRVRGLLAEYGVVIPRSPERLLTALPALTEDARLPDRIHALLLEVREQLSALHARLAKCDAHIAAHANHSTAAQRAMQLTGVGPVTASALAATVPDARVFRNGRRFGAWLGLTPRQHSSGGKTRLGRISLHGNVYLRNLLIQGARSTLQSALRADPAKANRLQRWISALYGRKGYFKTVIAIANKHARMLWAMLARDENYDASAWQRHPMTSIASPKNP